MSDEFDKIILEDYENEFSFKRNKSNLNIVFNRIAFIFFLFFIISIIYSIQLLHLGSRNDNIKKNDLNITSKKNYRADLVDINNIYLAKTISSIDIGINPREVIDKKKIINKFKIDISRQRLWSNWKET